MVWFFLLVLQFLQPKASGPGPLLCLGEIATSLWQLGSSAMTDNLPTVGQGQGQEPTSQCDKTAAAVAGKKDSVFCSYYISLAVLLCFQEKRKRRLARAFCSLGEQIAVPSEAK